MQHQKILLWGILIGALAGAFCGWFFGSDMQAVAWIGQFFLQALKMLIIPLIIAAVISGIASIGDVRKMGKLGGFTILYYLCTTAAAVLIGLVVVNIFQPGVGVSTLEKDVTGSMLAEEARGFGDIILTLVDPSLVQAAADLNLLPIIIFCIFFGAALSTVGEQGTTLIRFFEGLNEVMMKLVIWVMYLAPVGVFALIASQLGAAGGGAAFWQEIAAVGWYVLTVILGLGIHFLVLFLVLFLMTGRGRQYLVTMLRALVTAFGTASSSATLPLTMECATEAGVDKRSVRFVLPVGATVNMDGTALYEAVAVMFIAQAYGISMGIEQQAIIFVTATLAAIGAAGIPQAGLVTMLIVLSAVNLPAEGISLLLAVDWFLDRFRTSVNVWGDSVGAAVVEKLFLKTE
ncbi:MAG: dicarboxylate/amino acid:cation symporter [Gammaproteobacteria bacterium]